MSSYHHRPLRQRPRGVPEGALLIGAALCGEGVQHRFGDHGGLVALGAPDAEWLDDALANESVHRFAGDG